MTDYSHKPGGVLFKNSRKEKENQPDRTGNIIIDELCLDSLMAARNSGQPLKLELSGWVKSSKGGQYLSLSAKPPYDQKPSQGGEQRATQQTRVPSLDDDIPF